MSLPHYRRLRVARSDRPRERIKKIVFQKSTQPDTIPKAFKNVKLVFAKRQTTNEITFSGKHNNIL